MTKPSYEELEAQLAAHEKVIIERLRKDPTTRFFGLSADEIQRLIHIERAGGWNTWTRRIEQERDLYKSELARVRGLLQRQWISVEERLPDVGQSVLALSRNTINVLITERRHEAEKWNEPPWALSHWMPLPDHPTFPQSSDPVSQGTESADIGKLDAADEKADV